MSRVQKSPTTRGRRTVMVRAYGDEPVRLTALGVLSTGAVEVVGADPNRSTGFPVKDVFRFDARLYDRLRAAFDNGDHEGLTALWSEATAP